MIRATKGRLDGWMDGEDLIICVARLVVQKLCAPLLSDDLRVVSIASRNKLRSTSLSGWIWKVLGSQDAPKTVQDGGRARRASERSERSARSAGMQCQADRGDAIEQQ